MLVRLGVLPVISGHDVEPEIKGEIEARGKPAVKDDMTAVIKNELN